MLACVNLSDCSIALQQEQPRCPFAGDGASRARSYTFFRCLLLAAIWATLGLVWRVARQRLLALFVTGPVTIPRAGWRVSPLPQCRVIAASSPASHRAARRPLQRHPALKARVRGPVVWESLVVAQLAIFDDSGRRSTCSFEAGELYFRQPRSRATAWSSSAFAAGPPMKRREGTTVPHGSWR